MGFVLELLVLGNSQSLADNFELALVTGHIDYAFVCARLPLYAPFQLTLVVARAACYRDPKHDINQGSYILVLRPRKGRFRKPWFAGSCAPYCRDSMRSPLLPRPGAARQAFARFRTLDPQCSGSWALATAL